MRRYDRLGNNPREAEQRQYDFANTAPRIRSPDDNPVPLLPENYVRHTTGLVTHQDYQPLDFRGGENLALGNYKDFVWACKGTLRSIPYLLRHIYDIYNEFTEKVRNYMTEDTTRTGRDPNNNVYLSIHRGNLLIQDLEDVRTNFNNLIDDQIEIIRVAQSDLGYELPEEYSAPWHLDPDERRLINNSTGYYQDP